MAEQAVYQLKEGGSIPTSPLQSLRVESCELQDIRAFVETNHYSKTVKGVTVSACFRVLSDGQLKGAAIFGVPAGFGVLKKYSGNGKIRTVELRRFVLAQELPKNSESRVLGVMLRMIKKQGIQRVLSYADPAFGHQGTIYKATGFKLLGRTGASRKIVWNGKSYPRRNLLQIHRPFHKQLQKALADGDAVYERVAGKYIYIKDLGS